MATELPPERLRRTFDPAQITLPATEAPPGDSGIIGQQRAVAALRFGLNMVHLQETFSDVVKTDKTGLSKTAHTRWMISAFANFLPGSTIFRLA